MDQATVPGNRLPSPKSGSWTTWIPRRELGTTRAPPARQKGVRHEPVSIVAMLTWLGESTATGPVRRDCAERQVEEDGWKALVNPVRASTGSSAVQVELWLIPPPARREARDGDRGGRLRCGGEAGIGRAPL